MVFLKCWLELGLRLLGNRLVSVFLMVLNQVIVCYLVIVDVLRTSALVDRLLPWRGRCFFAALFMRCEADTVAPESNTIALGVESLIFDWDVSWNIRRHNLHAETIKNLRFLEFPVRNETFLSRYLFALELRSFEALFYLIHGQEVVPVWCEHSLTVHVRLTCV